MAEVNAGYSIGINLDSAIEINIKAIYPLQTFQKFGLILEAGGLLTPDEFTFHLFAAPYYTIINNENWRVPIALGFELYHGKSLYYGIGGNISLHRRLTKNIYVGVNLGLTYAFDNIYNEFIGYDIKKEIIDDGTGNAMFADRPVPVYERKNHYGSYIYIKPSLTIGFQF